MDKFDQLLKAEAHAAQEVRDFVADEAFKRGLKEGKQAVRDDVSNILADERAKLLAQGRQQGVNETLPRIDAAREEGRLQGVEDGRSQAELNAENAVRNKAFDEGKREGDREGFKRGRGEGYKAGWNDAITTPGRDQKPK